MDTLERFAVLTACPQSEEIFLWKDNSTGERHVFFVGLINAHLERENDHKAQLVGILEEQYRFVIERNGVAQARVDALTTTQRDTPILFAELDNGQVVLIDGNHRLARRWQDGFRDVAAYVLPSNFWKRFHLLDTL